MTIHANIGKHVTAGASRLSQHPELGFVIIHTRAKYGRAGQPFARGFLCSLIHPEFLALFGDSEATRGCQADIPDWFPGFTGGIYFHN